MISKHNLEQLLQRLGNGQPVFSLFLDMSVGPDNKRTHQIFLAQKRGEFDELDSDRPNHHREAIGEVFARVQRWLDTEYAEENRGVVIYAEVGGGWFQPLQFPVSVQNRLVISDRPFIGPLAQVIESYHHHGVVLLDREHVRVLSVYLGTLLDEIEVHGDPYPAAHDVQAGGFSQQRYQRRKLEEMRHFFREFAAEVEGFVNRYRPDDLVILGTDENISQFVEFLPERVREMVIHTGPMSVDEPAPEVLERLEPHLRAERERESRALVDRLRERVKQDYLATAGFQGTLTALQEGKVDTLVLAQDRNRNGHRCAACGFVFAGKVSACSYCGSAEVEEVDAAEEMVRMAEVQGVEIAFVEPDTVSDLRGVGALLRY